MKMVCVAIALTFLGAAAASAQSVEIGPGGVRFGLYPPPPPPPPYYGRGGYRVRGYGRCRTIIVRRENRYGETVIRRIRKCR
jgi:hypothetical protein